MYSRVIPRDLFNEAKLLKCLGRLCLLIHEEKLKWKIGVEHDEPEKGFVIDQNAGSGDLYCINLGFYLKGYRLDFLSSYNDKSNYPLLCSTENGEFSVFNEDGTLTEEFSQYLDSLTETN